MSDIESTSNIREKLAKRPDLVELLKTTAASKAEVNKETARLEQEVAALRAFPCAKLGPATPQQAGSACQLSMKGQAAGATAPRRVPCGWLAAAARN